MRFERHERAIGTATVVAAVAGTVLAPIHALSRYATEDGKEDLESAAVRTWADPAREVLSPLLDWSNPDTVYLSYGKLWLPIFATATLCALAVRRHRSPRTIERWAWRVTLTGYVLLTLQLLGSYWTPYLDESFVLLGLPGMLLALPGSTVLGAALLRRNFRPVGTALLLALWIPAMLGLSSLIALGAAAMPMILAWALAGRRLGAAAAPDTSRTRKPDTAAAAP
jgi:hypothetical protein